MGTACSSANTFPSLPFLLWKETVPAAYRLWTHAIGRELAGEFVTVLQLRLQPLRFLFEVGHPPRLAHPLAGFLGKRVAQVFPALFGKRLQTTNHRGVLRG